MITKYYQVDPLYPNIITLKKGADAIKEGKVVAFPTETVYGLGADAFNVNALEKIYEIKGRPLDNPMILHISSAENLHQLARHVPDKAAKAIKAFWPGPLTVVLPKKMEVPDIVSAGLPTVAIRMPLHAVALKLIKLAKVPIAAPSANLSGRPSPTTGLHVLRDLKGRVEMIIDGGPCLWGIESTVVDFTSEVPLILRPGAVTIEMLEAVVGQVKYDCALHDSLQAPVSPGLKYVHYAPKGKMYMVAGENSEKITKKIQELIEQYQRKNKRVAALVSREILKEIKQLKPDYLADMGSVSEMELVASRIYPLLRNCDKMNIEIIITHAFPEEGLGAAVMNRLIKASGNRIVKA